MAAAACYVKTEEVFHRPWFFSCVRRWLLPFRPTNPPFLGLLSSEPSGGVRVVCEDAGYEDLLGVVRDLPLATHVHIFTPSSPSPTGGDVTLVRCIWEGGDDERVVVAVVEDVSFVVAENKATARGKWEGGARVLANNHDGIVEEWGEGGWHMRGITTS